MASTRPAALLFYLACGVQAAPGGLRGPGPDDRAVDGVASGDDVPADETAVGNWTPEWEGLDNESWGANFSADMWAEEAETELISERESGGSNTSLLDESTMALAGFVSDAHEDMHANVAWGRHRHHYSRNIMTLYHTTSPAAASAILRSGFRPGSSGWCGGAIYFLRTPYLPRSKYGPATKTGAIIQATVDMGRMAYMDKRCHGGMSQASRRGYDSLTFNPGDGSEYVILSASRVLSMRRYK